jgi:FixJ family two-component response regulator
MSTQQRAQPRVLLLDVPKQLLAEGLHNPEIADRLLTSPRTVEHHISAVLAKLEARSRAEAIRLAHDQRLIFSSEVGPPAIP